jgi:hypothetical protein
MLRYKLHTLLILLALAVMACLMIVAYQSSRALRGSHTLVMGKIVTRAVEQYVSQHGNWPKSWSDLEGFAGEPITKSMKEAVIVDFDAELDHLAHQSSDDLFHRQ